MGLFSVWETGYVSAQGHNIVIKMTYQSKDSATHFRATHVVTIYPRRVPSLEITSEIILLCSSDLNIEPSELSIILFSSLSISEGCLTWKSSWLVIFKASLLKTLPVKRSGSSSVDREKPRREQKECSFLASTSSLMCRGGLMPVTCSHRSLPLGKVGIRVKIRTVKGNWWQKLTFSWHSPFYSLPILQTREFLCFMMSHLLAVPN